VKPTRAHPARLAGVVNATGSAMTLRPLANISSAEFRHLMIADVEDGFNLHSMRRRPPAYSTRRWMGKSGEGCVRWHIRRHKVDGNCLSL